MLQKVLPSIKKHVDTRNSFRYIHGVSETRAIAVALVEGITVSDQHITSNRYGKTVHQFLSTSVDNTDDDTSEAVCAENNWIIIWLTSRNLTGLNELWMCYTKIQSTFSKSLKMFSLKMCCNPIMMFQFQFQYTNIQNEFSYLWSKVKFHSFSEFSLPHLSPFSDSWRQVWILGFSAKLRPYFSPSFIRMKFLRTTTFLRMYEGFFDIDGLWHNKSAPGYIFILRVHQEHKSTAEPTIPQDFLQIINPVVANRWEIMQGMVYKDHTISSPWTRCGLLTQV